MTAVRTAIAAGVLMLLGGFALGVEPVSDGDKPCGTVLLSLAEGRYGSSGRGCSTDVGGSLWLATWGLLTVGGVLVLVGSTAYRERSRDWGVR